MKAHGFVFPAMLIVSMMIVPGVLSAQTVDHSQIKQVIIFGRHAVRTPILPNNGLDMFSALGFPQFAASGVAVITPNGATNETHLGGYFRALLTNEGLLTGNDAADASFVYIWANNTPLIINTAQAFAAGLLPAATVNVNSVTPPANDPLFSAVAAGVAPLDENQAVAAVNGRLGGNAPTISSAYAPELALTRSVLFDYPVNTDPVPPTPAGKTDVTAIPITIGAGDSTLPVNLGGLEDVATAIDPFVMEYADGMAASQVGWGQLDVTSIGQIDRLYELLLDLEFRTPYLARVQSSNLASHIVRTLVQAATGNAMSGALGSPSSKIVILVASNTNINGLAALFQLEWLLPTYQRDVAAPGGALMFELRQSQSTGEFIVRASYVAQTMDQLRTQAALSLDAPPATAPVFIPNCSVDNATFDCPLSKLVELERNAVDPRAVDLEN